MISLFRNFFQSKIGLPIFIGFLIVVALAFAASDISGSSTFGGLSGDDKVAIVGDESISSTELNAAVTEGLRRIQGQNPTVTMPQFIAQGGFDAELDLYINRYAAGMFGRAYGLRSGDNLINSEILQFPQFQDLTGEFSQDTYSAFLQRQGITDAELRRDISDGLLAQQFIEPAYFGLEVPETVARHYTALRLERRNGQIALIPSIEFAPEEGPTDEQLEAFYAENRSDYMLPERRTIRFASFGPANVDAEITPTDEQIAVRFEADAALYDASEQRAITSFVVPTEAAARAIVERIRGGVSLEAAAQEAEFNVSSSPLRDREALNSATSFAVGESVFAAELGEIAEPARSTLGWYVARVDEIENTPARTLADVRDQISEQLQDEARALALAQLSEEIEGKVDGGVSLSDIAVEYELEITAVPDITADGRVFGDLSGQGLSPALQPLVGAAFQMDQNDPQIAELVPGTQFLVFDVDQIVQSAPPPLEGDVRETVELAWRLAEGSKGAQEAANRIMAAVRDGASLDEAMRAENAELDQIQTIDLTREELLARFQNTPPPPPIVLLFSMAQGTTKVLEDRNDIGWYVIDLATINVDAVEGADESIADTQRQISNVLPSEYNSQLSQGIREDVGVERNEDAIEALRSTLSGES